MKIGKIWSLLWLFPAIIFVLHASKAYTYDTKEGGHIGISRKSIGLKIKLHGGDNLSQELGAYSGEIINGNVKEDTAPFWLDHFYDPTTGKGLWGRYTPAPEKGKTWYEIAKKEYERKRGQIYFEGIIDMRCSFSRIATCERIKKINLSPLSVFRSN